MLSYKLKHICSRVIASLSAVGIISIAHSNDANAATDRGTASGMTYVEPGDTFKYNLTSSLTLDAEYKEIESGCSMVLSDDSDGNFESFVYTTGTTGTSGKAPKCTYTCKAGYTWADTTYTTGIVEGSAGVKDDYVVPGTGCVPAKLICTVGENYSGTISMGVSGIEGKEGGTGKAYCTWTCKDGYSVNGGADTTTTYTSAEGSYGEQFPTANCKARQYKVTFDCGAGGLYNGTSIATGVATATYGQKFTVPTDAVCTKDGYNFSGWAK